MTDHHHSHPPAHDDGPPARPPTLGSHGMLIVGEVDTYLSHFPMFMFDPADHAHNFQVVLRVGLEPPADGGPAADLLGDRRENPGTRLYTSCPPCSRWITSIPGTVRSTRSAATCTAAISRDTTRTVEPTSAG